MYYEEEQASLFAPDTQSTKTYRERSVATPAKIGRQSSRSSSESQTQTLQPFLFLQKGSGINGEDIWEKDLTVGGVLPLGCMTPNGSEFRSVDAESVLSLTTADGQHTGYCLTLNTGEKPRTPVQSRLSQILEKWTDPKYKLSAKACMGILSRAERRGKALPAELKIALEAQSVSKSAPESQEEEKESSSKPSEREQSALSPTSPSSTVCLEGNGMRESHRGDGWKESDQMYTLNTTEQHAVAYGIDQQGGKGGANYAEDVMPPILSDSHGTPHAVAYGISPYASNAMLSPNPHSGIYKAETSRTLDFNGGSPACNQGGIAIVESVDAAYVDTTHADDVVRMDDTVAPLQARDFKGGKLICEKEPVCIATSCVNAEITQNGISPALLARAGTGGNQLPIITRSEPTLLESNQNHATITKSGICTTLPASMGEGGGYVPMVAEPTVYNGECITSPTNKANPKPGDPCHTLTDDTRNYVVAGFSMGQAAHARSIGYQEEVSPTLRGGEGGNQKPHVMISEYEDETNDI